MTRKFWLRGAVYVGTLSMLIGLSAWQEHSNHSSATSLCTETEIAGISLSLDKYYETNIAEESAAAAAEEEKKKTAEEEAEQKAKQNKIKKTTVKEDKKSEYDNIGISIANDYVNIRKESNTHSKIKGKLYRGCAAEILKVEGKWAKIKSGSVKGYIRKDYLAIGFSAEELVDKYAKKKATVTTETLFVRQHKSTESTILTMIPEDEQYTVIEEGEYWAKIRVDDTKGFVKKDYVKITAEFKEAVSIKEERAKLRAKRKAEKAAAAARAAAEARAAEEARQQAAASNAGNSSSSNNSSSQTTTSSSGSSSSNTSSSNGASSISVGAGTGSEVASYAQSFVGNPYKYGGTSLTNGTDCSGFTQSVYKHFGYNIPRTSSSQSSYGKSVSLDTGSLQPGDLIFYTSGGHVNHVAMYIGGGQVVHASNPDDGIKISNWKYRTPYCARRIIY